MSRWARIGLATIAALLAGYLLIAYVVLPFFWKEKESAAPTAPTAAGGLPKITHNGDGIPGDPLNVGLVGSRKELVAAMIAAGWRPADPITFDSSLEIADSVLFDRPDPTAPVSDLFVFGRKQDLAFEKEVGSSADHRHHVRFWHCAEKWDVDGRTLWIGDAAYDKGSGVSGLTGQITHHIDADVDAERDTVFADLEGAGRLERRYSIDGVGPTQDGRNAGGDRYYTDGKMTVGVLRGN